MDDKELDSAISQLRDISGEILKSLSPGQPAVYIKVDAAIVAALIAKIDDAEYQYEFAKLDWLERD